MSIDGVINNISQAGITRDIYAGGPIDKKKTNQWMDAADEMGAVIALNMNDRTYHHLQKWDSGPREGKIMREWYFKDTNLCQLAEPASHGHLVPFEDKEDMKKFLKWGEHTQRAKYIHEKLPYLSLEEAREIVDAHPLASAKECKYDHAPHRRDTGKSHKVQEGTYL